MNELTELLLGLAIGIPLTFIVAVTLHYICRSGGKGLLKKDDWEWEAWEDEDDE